MVGFLLLDVIFLGWKLFLGVLERGDKLWGSSSATRVTDWLLGSVWGEEGVGTIFTKGGRGTYESA